MPGMVVWRNNSTAGRVGSRGIHYWANEINTYDAAKWGKLTKIEQAHAGAVTTGTPAVQFDYEDGLADNAAKFVRLSQVTYPSTGSAARTVYYRYGSSGSPTYALSRLDSMDDNAGTPKVFAQYSYLGAGTIVKVAHPAVTGGLNLTYDPAGDKSYAGWDSLSRVVDQKWVADNGTTVKDQFQYQYDAGSNRTYRLNTQVTARAEKYDYDSLNRLTAFTRGTGSTFNTPTVVNKRQQFGLDAVGNWGTFKDGSTGTTWDIEQTRTHNKANEIDTTDDHGDAHTEAISGSGNADWFNPAYDAAGNMTEGPRNPSGFEWYLSSEEYGMKLTYDAWNRVMTYGITNPYNREQSAVSSKFRYDGNHYRIAKIAVENYSPVTWKRTDYYYNADWQVLEERYAEGISDGSEGAPVTTLSRQYLWDIRYIDSPVLHWQDGNANVSDGLETAVYYTTDANCNVTALFNSDGTVGQRYRYTPYGRWVSEGGSLSTDILYCGYRHDPDTGLYLARHRYYHPTLGRWTSRDPLGYVDGVNLYGYCRGMPTTLVDPKGESPFLIVAAILLLVTDVAMAPTGKETKKQIARIKSDNASNVLNALAFIPAVGAGAKVFTVTAQVVARWGGGKLLAIGAGSLAGGAAQKVTSDTITGDIQTYGNPDYTSAHLRSFAYSAATYFVQGVLGGVPAQTTPRGDTPYKLEVLGTKSHSRFRFSRCEAEKGTMGDLVPGRGTGVKIKFEEVATSAHARSVSATMYLTEQQAARAIRYMEAAERSSGRLVYWKYAGLDPRVGVQNCTTFVNNTVSATGMGGGLLTGPILPGSIGASIMGPQSLLGQTLRIGLPAVSQLDPLHRLLGAYTEPPIPMGTMGISFDVTSGESLDGQHDPSAFDLDNSATARALRLMQQFTQPSGGGGTTMPTGSDGILPAHGVVPSSLLRNNGRP